MKLRFSRTTVGLAAGTAAAVLAACFGGAYLYSRHHFGTVLETARQTALAESELVRVSLEHQMIENDRSLLREMIRSFGNQPRVERVMLLDRLGKVQFTSHPGEPDQDFRLDSPTCQACHQLPPAQRAASRIVETREGQVLRTMVPIRNRAECHGCHDPSHGINGVLLFDYGVGDLKAQMAEDLRWMAGGTGLFSLLLLGAIGLLLRGLVLRRLQRFESTARQIAAGDFAQRVPAEGNDTISWLAREFNYMADSVTGLAEEVRSQRERLETVINSIDDGIVVLDPERKILAANAAFLNRVGKPRESALGCGCHEMAGALCGVGECPAGACLQSGKRQVRICERTAEDGSVAWEEVHASPVIDAAGKLQQVVEVWRDISGRRAAEAKLAESHRLTSLGMMASGFSHEMNTPLATVLTCVEGILRESAADGADGAGPSRIQDYGRTAREQVLRCKRITQQVLRLSRGQKPGMDVVDVAEAVRSVRPLLEPMARQAQIKLEFPAVAGSVCVRAEEAELQNVLINLVLNAIQASRPGGQVTVAVDAGNEVRISVRDEGCGITAANRKRIFDPFFSMRDGGTGLGLFLSLQAVQRWGGDIGVESAPGKGSVFTVTLPAVPLAEEEAGPA